MSETMRNVQPMDCMTVTAVLAASLRGTAGLVVTEARAESVFLLKDATKSKLVPFKSREFVAVVEALELGSVVVTAPGWVVVAIGVDAVAV